MKLVFKSKQKIAVLTAGVLAALAVGIGLTISPKSAKADTTIPVGTLVAQDVQSTVLKDTHYVKRWQECTFSLYYMGDCDDVFISEIHTPLKPTSPGTLEFSASTQLITSYSVTETISASVTLELGITKGISLEGFMKQASAKATSTITASYAATVGMSETNNIAYSAKYNIGDADNPVNKIYGNLLMINHAYKFKLVTYKQQHAKHRKKLTDSWSDYEIESAETQETYFYTLNGSNGFFYQMIGLIGTEQEYSNIINNVGK